MARMRIFLVAATATIAAFAAPTTASAATTGCDGLQSALSNPANDVVTLNEGAVCTGHWDLPQREIVFEGAGSGATLSGDLGKGGNTQILSGDGVGATTIRNLTFRDGSASEDGGAITLGADSPVTLENNTFLSNDADDDGGAVSIQEFLVFDTVTARGDGPSIVLRGNTFGGPDEGNESDDEGGGLIIDTFRHVILEDNTFAHNQAGDDGGGASVSTCAADLIGNTFDQNVVEDEDATLHGGGLDLSGDDCNSNDRARGLLAPAVFQDANRFTGNVIRGEFTTAEGGGEYIEDLVTLSTSDRFVGNSIQESSDGFGAGLAYEGQGAQPFSARNLVAAGNEIAAPAQAPGRGESPDNGAGGGLALLGDDSEFRIEDSTIEGNTAGQGSGIFGNFGFTGPKAARTEFPSDKLLLYNSIVHGNTGAADNPEFPLDGEILGFFERDVRSSDTCVDGEPHPDGDGADPNSNVCVDPELAGPSGDENVNQTGGSPTIDAGDDALVDGDLEQDYAGDGRVLDGDEDGTVRVDMGADEFVAQDPVDPEPTPEPTTQPPPAVPQPAAAVQAQQSRPCRSRRSFRIRIRVPKGKRAKSAVVRVNGKRVRVVRGKRLRAPVRLTGLPKGRFVVRITVRLRNGKKLTGRRVYHTCIPRLPGDGPPPL
jgi:hypothetical protein